jgi:hypothetical protein
MLSRYVALAWKDPHGMNIVDELSPKEKKGGS